MSILRMTEEQYAARLSKGRRSVDPERRPSKYGNTPVDGYASGKEAHRAKELKLRELRGEIRNLREQVKYELIPAQYRHDVCVERACSYIADFAYEEGPLWIPITEDVKSPASKTPAYKIKRKLLLQVHGIRVRET